MKIHFVTSPFREQTFHFPNDRPSDPLAAAIGSDGDEVKPTAVTILSPKGGADDPVVRCGHDEDARIGFQILIDNCFGPIMRSGVGEYLIPESYNAIPVGRLITTDSCFFHFPLPTSHFNSVRTL